MKGKIDRDGRLCIERAGNIKIQKCPYQSGPANCGDWCPHFGESEISYTHKYDIGSYYLEITCGQGRVFVFKEFTDERGTK
jgi:hypothetical protein